MRTSARRLVLFIIVAAAFWVAGANPATAAPIRECGDMPSQLAGNITTRVVTCREARKVVKAWVGRGTVRVRGLNCRYRDLAHELGDIRCSGSGGRVVHWQTGV